jgi:monofunctional biosynthetic peptidoglycan transglycosylase
MTPDTDSHHSRLLDPGRIDWEIINDGVMGGMSQARLEADGVGIRFSGTLSTANGGGFASFRGRVPGLPLPLARLRLTVSGDGRRYQVRLRDSERADAVAWRALFDTGSEPATVELQPGEFEAVLRGRRLVALPPLSQRDISMLGFMLTSREPGPFQLRIHAIEWTGGGGGND